MTTITIKAESIKEIRKAMRNLESWHETLLIEGVRQIRKTGKTYAVGPLPEDDDSDPMTDYTAWTYGMREKWILDELKVRTGIA